MILSYLTHGKWNIQPGTVLLIETSSQIAYRDLIQGFKGENDLVLLSSDNYDPIEINKKIDLVGDLLLSEDILDRYLTLIEKNYIEKLDEDNRNKILNLYRNLENAVQNSLLLEDIPLEISFDEDLKKLLKCVNLHFNVEFSKSPYHLVEMILNIYQSCGLAKLPVICNPEDYLSQAELLEVAKMVKVKNVPLILVQFTNKYEKLNAKNMDTYYIDEDLVDWH